MNGSEIISFEPATGAELWRGAPSDMDALLATAQKAWPAWAAVSAATRIGVIRRFADEIRKDSEVFAQLLARETGKPLWEAFDEVMATTTRAEMMVRAQAERAAQRRLNNGIGGALAVRHKPHGVMAVLGSYSQPLLVPAGHILPALLAGNAVIFKPSAKTPACAELLVQCLARSGVPVGVIQCAIGDDEAGRYLVASDVVQAVAFSGSAHTGVAIARKLAARPDKLLTLEMGGNNPLVVWDTPLVEDAAVLIVQSAFTGAGQRFNAARRLIVGAHMYQPVMEAVKRIADRIIIGAPFDEPTPFMGPVIDMEAADGLTESFIYLMSNGGKPIKQMQRPHGDLPFVTPAIIDVTAMTERPDIELFGPLLQVIRVDDFDEAIAVAGATRYGLVAGLIGGTPQQYNHFWASARAGIVTWNRPTITELGASPVGGVGLSGNHRPGGGYAVDYCSYPVTSVELEQPRASLGTGFSAG